MQHPSRSQQQQQQIRGLVRSAMLLLTLTGCTTKHIAPTHAEAHRTIATRLPAAQQAFDRGLMMMYAFNMGQAQIEFAHAAEIDPQCAMAYWGSALSEISDINVPPDDEAIAKAKSFATQARTATEATPADRALINALATRFGQAQDSDERRKAYADAMDAYAKAHAQDADGLLFAALALWSFNDPASDKPESVKIASDLHQALRLDPDNIGVHHMRIHFYEITDSPQTALADADYLDHLHYDLGESHLAHMAGHIYLRLGSYEQMAAANKRALKNDEGYFAEAHGAGQAYMLDYHLHVLTNYLYAETTIGEASKAYAVAKAEPDYIASLEAVRDRRWPLAHTVKRIDDAVSIGVAAARHGDFTTADHMDNLIATTYSHDDAAARDLLLIDAARAGRQANHRRALHDYEQLYTAYSFDLGDPPDGWYLPIPEGYGAELLRSGNWQPAAQIFAEGLQHRPNDPHLLFGLAVAQQHAGVDESKAWQAYRQHWHGPKPLTIDDLG